MDTAFRKSIEQEFINTKKLAESSTKLYLRNLERLNDDSPLKNLNFLKDPEIIIKKIDNYKDNTRRGYLISICSVLSLDKNTPKKQKLYDVYFKMMMDMNRRLKSSESENEKTDTQKDNWLEWSEVEKKWDELHEKVSAYKGTMNPQQYDNILQYVILSLYVLLPPRRNEYQHMVVAKSVTDPNPDINYYNVDNQQMIFNKFKTAKKEGQKIIDIPLKLQGVLRTYIKFHPLLKGKVSKTEVPFLVHQDGSPFNQVNSITRILNKIFKRNVGSSMLRHIYLSSKYGDVQEQQKTDAEMMGHSTGQQKDYIKK